MRWVFVLFGQGVRIGLNFLWLGSIISLFSYCESKCSIKKKEVTLNSSLDFPACQRCSYLLLT